jgi:hypothetical protein
VFDLLFFFEFAVFSWSVAFLMLCCFASDLLFFVEFDVLFVISCFAYDLLFCCWTAVFLRICCLFVICCFPYALLFCFWSAIFRRIWCFVCDMLLCLWSAVLLLNCCISSNLLFVRDLLFYLCFVVLLLICYFSSNLMFCLWSAVLRMICCFSSNLLFAYDLLFYVGSAVLRLVVTKLTFIIYLFILRLKCIFKIRNTLQLLYFYLIQECISLPALNLFLWENLSWIMRVLNYARSSAAHCSHKMRLHLLILVSHSHVSSELSTSNMAPTVLRAQTASAMFGRTGRWWNQAMGLDTAVSGARAH